MSMDDLKSLLVNFSLTNGLSPDVEPIQRKLSAMQGMYLDVEKQAEMAAADDVVVYEFHDMGLPEKDSEIAFGTSIVYPGKVGNEYFMTKGHFHTVLDTAEVYFCLSGNGTMLMENPEGDWEARELKSGDAVYVPGRYAHRSINVSLEEPLVTFFAFRGDAGHDYGTIETRGYRKLVVDDGGKPAVIDNPRWQVK
jgi:glucose-6-phosphate isomerase